MDDTVAESLYAKVSFCRSLPQEQKSRIFSLFKNEQNKDPSQDVRKFRSLMQASIYLVCQESFFPFQFAQLFDGESELHNFMISLRGLLNSQSLELSTVQLGKKLIKSYAISLMNYKKIEEILEKFSFLGNFEHIVKFYQAIWLFFVLIRKNDFNSTEVLSDCGCLIISVIQLFILNLPEGLSHMIKIPIYDFLCDTFRTASSFVESFKQKTEDFSVKLLREFHENSLQDSLKVSNLSRFLDFLSELYESKSSESDIDERLIRNVVFNNELLLTPVKKKNMRMEIGEVGAVNLNTQLRDLECPKPVSMLIQTPITASMECNSWIIRTLEEYNENSIIKTCSELFSEIKSRAESLRNLLVSLQKNHFYVKKTEEILKLYYIALESLIKIEKSKGNEVNGILQNDKFHRALFACSAETMFFIVFSSSSLFEDLLKILEISAFDFWKNIKSFTQFNIRMPSQVKKHFSELEERILVKDGWDESSPVSQAINRMTSESFANELLHPSFGQFFKSVLSHSGFKIVQISNSLEIPPLVQEKIWSTFKYFLSEKTENMIGRHLDQIIGCSVYSVCKVEKVPEITFKRIFEVFNSIFMTSFEVFEKVKMRDGETENLIVFYNKVFIEMVKDFLVNKVNLVNPRISSLHPMSPLKMSYNSFQSPRQAFMTPRTKKLYAFGEHSSHAVESINQMIQVTARKLDFSAPVKKPKLEKE